MRISLDFETRSLLDIRDVGTARYCEDDSTEVLLMAIAKDDDPPVLWTPDWLQDELASDPESYDLLDKLGHLEEGDTVHAYNYLFEWMTLKHKFDLEIPIRHWRCTQLLGSRGGYANNLGTLTKQLKLESGEKIAGKTMINFFCSPISSGKKKGEFRDPRQHSVRFYEFAEYCIQDVRTERECANILRPHFESKGITRKAFEATHRMNVRGVPINVPLMDHAQEQLDDAVNSHTLEFESVVGCKPTQRDRCLEWFQDRGYPFDSLAKDLVDDVLEREVLDDRTARMLKLRSDTTPAAVKKLKKMDMMVCHDDTIKGVMAFFGAYQTGRWSSKALQLQNMKRPVKGITERFFGMLQHGQTWREIEGALGASYIYLLSTAIRNFIGDPDLGWADADYSSVEARITAWLAGQEDLLEDFRAGVDAYKAMAAYLYQKDLGDVTDDERAMGKALVLGAGFSLGAKGFAGAAGCEEDVAEKAISSYRDKHSEIVDLWNRLERAALAAMDNPGKIYMGNRKGLPPVTYQRRTIGQDEYLVCRIPSGRELYYLRPEVSMAKTPWGAEKRQIRFWCKDQVTGKYFFKKIWRGILIENIVQAIAADLMMHGCLNAMASGFDVRMLVHDEPLAVIDPERPELNGEYLAECIAKLPRWATGLPLAAEGTNVPYYTK